MSLAKSKAGDLHSSDSWLDEVNHTDYAASIQLTNAESVLKQAAELAQADGTKAYDKVKEIFSTEEAKAALQSLLARGYQLRYYDANGKMLAVYVNDTAWADVNEAENGIVTADALEAVADPTAEDVSAVSLKSLYVYYGGYEGRSREGEGVWFILNPGKTDLTAETYTWKNDKPEGGFQKKEEPKPAVKVQMTSYNASQTFSNYDGSVSEATATITYGIGGNTIHMIETWTQNGEFDMKYDVTVYLAGGTISRVEQNGYNGKFYVTPGTRITSVKTTTSTADGQTRTGEHKGDMYAGFGSYGLGVYDATTGAPIY